MPQQSLEQLEIKVRQLEEKLQDQGMVLTAVRQDLARYRSLYDQLPHPYHSLDLEGNILEVNTAWLDLLGYTYSEVIGTHFTAYLHPEWVDYFRRNFSVFKTSGRRGTIEFKMLKKDREPLFVSLDGQIGKRDGDTSLQTHCIFHEITERKRIESQRDMARDAWNQTFDAIEDVVTIQDDTLRIIKANKASYTLFQVDDGELEGRYCYEVFTGTSVPCPSCPLLDTLDDKDRHSAVIHHEGLKTTFLVSSSLLPGERCGKRHLVHVARDISDRVQVELALKESEECFAKAFRSNPAPMVITDLHTGEFIDVNRRWLQMIGYSTGELIGRSSKDTGIWIDLTERDRLAGELAVKGSIREYPIQFRTKSGAIRSTLWSGEKISLGGREVMLSLIYDFTERLEAEKTLRESEQKFALAFDSNPDAVNINRLEDGLYVEINRGFTALTGFTDEDVRGRTSLDIDIWHDPADRLQFVKDLKARGYCENLEGRFRKKDGSLATALMSARIISLKGVPHIISITRDISKHKKAEQEVAAQKRLFETMFNAIDDGVVITDNKRNIVVANRGMAATFGYDQEELSGKNSAVLFADPGGYASTGERILSIAEGGKQFSVFEYRHKSGKLFPGETFGAKLFDHENQWIGNLAIIRDISERQNIEAERERLIAAIEQTSEVIVITDLEGRIEYVNPAFEEISGYTQVEALGENPRILKSGKHDEQFYQRLWQTISNGATFTDRIVNRRKDGTLYTEEATISPVCDANAEIVNYIAVKRDITSQLVLESQLHQAQKMESVGRLTGGVAHDFNNILAIITGYAEMALGEVNPSGKLYRDLVKILDAAGRSADIIRQLLAFSRQQAIAPKVLDLNSMVEGMLKMIRRLIGEDIVLSWYPQVDLPPVKMDPVQMDQILVNLCVNARDAISDTGRLTIETDFVSLDNEYCADHAGSSPGEYVLLVVSDNGCGIEKTDQDKIFEPFYTTKDPGQGTGLGLSTVYGIVKQNQGYINVYSEPDMGTTFKVYLPPCFEKPPQLEAISGRQAREGGNETVLVVEDETALLVMAKRMLERLGYHVIAANTPREAIDLTEACDGPIHLLLTDVVMPEMNGKELAGLLQTRFPGMKLLYMSGYTPNIIAHRGVLGEDIHLMQKPFTKADLAAKIREVLDEDGG